MSNDKIRQRVQNIYPAFTTDVDPDRLSDYLKKEGIISIAQWQDMCGKSATPHCRCRALLDFLLAGSNPRAFLVVREALEKESHYLLAAIDDDTSCLTEDKKTIKLLQHQLDKQVESTQVLEKRVQEAECEIGKLRKTVDDLRTELDRCQPKDERQSNNAHLKTSETRRTTAAAKDKESKYSHSGCATAENKGYSDDKDRDSPLSPSDVKFDLFVAERHESIMYLTKDSGFQGPKKITVRRGVLFPADMSVPDDSSPGQKSATLRASRSRTPLASEQYEPFVTEQKSATLRSPNSRSSTQKSATLRPSGSRTPCGSKQRERIEYKEESYLIKEIKTRASRENCKAIHGLAILDDDLFIISRVSSNIEVHGAYRLILVRRLELRILEVPWDIVSCKINKCLYIMNWKHQSKGIVRIDSNGNVIKQWSTGSNCGRLSIAQDSNIMLAAYKSDKIIEYNAEGGLVREIKLPYQLAHPQHAIKLNSSRFLVIHGMYDDLQQRLCLLDSTGCVLASFGGEKGSDKEHLHGPIYMAVDRAGSIFIAEYGNSRVLLLSKSLQFMRVLLSKEIHGLRDPWSIQLDEANGRLFVVDNDYEEGKNLLKDGRILVFHINSR